MGERLKTKKIKDDFQVATDFVNQLNEAGSKTDITITNLDFRKTGDQRIVLEVLLRGKSEDEYFSIVNGLFIASENGGDKKQKEMLGRIAGVIMTIGEENLGIDWH